MEANNAMPKIALTKISRKDGAAQAGRTGMLGACVELIQDDHSLTVAAR